MLRYFNAYLLNLLRVFLKLSEVVIVNIIINTIFNAFSFVGEVFRRLEAVAKISCCCGGGRIVDEEVI